MLSILIPVYNFDVTDLVRDLHREAVNLGEEIEIVLADDGFEDHWKSLNRPLEKLSPVKYEELSQNIGRSAIRNHLSAKAKYEYLLFLDNDMGIVSDDFLKRYLVRLRSEKVITGGLCYSKNQPENNYKLHWRVGSNREVKSAGERQKAPYESFLSCNFAVPKSIFESIKFDETLTQYGHEDTLFGLELERRGIEILHIENPLEHKGLEPPNVFLEKTEKAIENLVFLYRKTGFSKTKLIRIWLRINRLRLDRVVLFFLKTIKPLLLKNLKSKHPSLLIFDLYKLYVFLNKSREIKA